MNELMGFQHQLEIGALTVSYHKSSQATENVLRLCYLLTSTGQVLVQVPHESCNIIVI